MADSHAFHEVLKSLQGLMGQLQTWPAIWKLLENLSQQSKRINSCMTSFLISNLFFLKQRSSHAFFRRTKYFRKWPLFVINTEKRVAILVTKPAF